MIGMEGHGRSWKVMEGHERSWKEFVLGVVGMTDSPSPILTLDWNFLYLNWTEMDLGLGNCIMA